MSAAAPSSAQLRIANVPPEHDILRKLRTYRVGVVLCAFAFSLVFAAQSFRSPYRIPLGLELLVPLFLLLTVGIHLLLTRKKYFEIQEDGIEYRAAWGRKRFVTWEDIRDVKYFLGGGLPLSLRVRGKPASVTLGIPHRQLESWTAQALRRTSFDLEAGGPLFAVQRPAFFWVGVLCLVLAALMSPIAMLRAIMGVTDWAVASFALTAGGAMLVWSVFTPVRWNATGIVIGHRRARTIPWSDIQAEWRPTLTGATGLYLTFPDRQQVRVMLSSWGVPRLVARLGLGHTSSAPVGDPCTVRTGPAFPVLLAIFTFIAGALLQTSALLVSEMGWHRMAAFAGPTVTGRVPSASRTRPRGGGDIHGHARPVRV